MNYAMDSTVLEEAIQSATIKCCRFHVKHGGGKSKLSGVMLITKTTRVKPTEVEDCFTEDTMQDCPDNQNCNKFADYLLENYVFTITLTNSSTHLIPPFSYLTSCI